MSVEEKNGGLSSPEVSAPTPDTQKFYSEAEYQQGLNSVASKVRKEASDRAARQYQPTSAPQQNSMPDLEAIAKQAAERGTQEALNKLYEQQQTQEKERQKQDALAAVNSYKQKLSEGEQKHKDFRTVTKNLPLDKMPGILQASMKNPNVAADVVYHLAKNPAIALMVEQSYGSGLEEAADAAISDLMKKSSPDVQQFTDAPAPLDQISHSPAHKGGDPQSVDDFLAYFSEK